MFPQIYIHSEIFIFLCFCTHFKNLAYFYTCVSFHSLHSMKVFFLQLKQFGYFFHFNICFVHVLILFIFNSFQFVSWFIVKKKTFESTNNTFQNVLRCLYICHFLIVSTLYYYIKNQVFCEKMHLKFDR